VHTRVTVSVVNIDEVLDGHASLEVECVGQHYLNAYCPFLQAGSHASADRSRA
jgi:hypothetical protein